MTGSRLSRALQVAVISAIVATLAAVPLALALALLLPWLGIPWASVLTFRGTVALLPGALLWWLILFAAASAYAAWVFPWGEDMAGWSARK